MASNGSSARVESTESSLERIKRQLTSGSGRYLLQGPLLKRSETLRKWNERWVILDPTTGKMEYKTRRNEAVIKGTIIFDLNSTITISPVNFHGLQKYDGCCFYIGTPQKKEYFLCAETPGAARAWVSTLHATQLVLRAHREAVNNLTGNGPTKLGTVATVVAAANSTAMEASKEIEAAMKISMRAALGLVANKPNEGHLDDLTIMKETLRVKDEELQHLAKDIRARDSTIKEIADKLTETAEAAEAAASAAHAMDEERRLACVEIERLTRDAEKKLEISQLKISEYEEKVVALRKEKELLLKQRDSALQEAHLWRSELAKAREQAVLLEAAVVRAEERARILEADAEARIKDASEKALAAAKEKEDLLALVNILQSQVERSQSNTKQVCEERSESCSGADDTLPLTKHVDSSEDDVDKACLSDSRVVPVSADSVVQLAEDGVEIHSIGDAEWSGFRPTDPRIADVREISPQAEGSSLDITVVDPMVDAHQLGVNTDQP
ncbi:pleckstrin domain-containing protein [Musa troglodytarum]|uniref:Pleckstrin domain-containing protein n=1 Tax=Musa troglodytarum TaxID=320322 RepID=A0A9E7K5M1_9LILI|nr:pleckstrin domain-containing protein [Musa troglodytarum]URE07373.1 pleckstrin domain-containing protein [Musa troglodytarum]URE07374.1 pleckstrin domain-containing protein [Musa troglodytarum]URE07375.1 pleckstrin domain-containing protein [Musa troglodytarum]